MRQFLQDVYPLTAITPATPVSTPYGRYRSASERLTDFHQPSIWELARASNTPVSEPVALPCIATVCMNCGFTEFYNVHVLGLAEVLGIPKAGSPIG
jgi:hypothetical protein